MSRLDAEGGNADSYSVKQLKDRLEALKNEKSTFIFISPYYWPIVFR